MKRLKWILIPLAIIAGFWAYFKYASNPSIDALQVIPNDAMYIIDCDAPIENWKELSSHEIWHVLKKHPVFEDLTIEADYLDSLIDANSSVFSALGQRQLIVSAHPTKPKDYDFLFVVDLKDGAKHGLVLRGLEQLLKSSGMDVSSSEYEGIRLIHSRESKESMLTLAQIENQMVCSYTADLVKRSIDASRDSSLGVNPDFQEVFHEIGGNDIARFYMNYGYLYELMSVYFDEGLDMYHDLSELLKFTAADFDVDKTSWTLEGFTNIHEQESYLKSVINSGKSENTAGEVLSNRTAWFLSFNYESFDKFYEELQKQWALDSSFNQSYEKYSRQIESLLKISIEDNFLGWFGNEVTVAQLRNNSTFNKKQSSLVLIKTSDIESARENLNIITQQVKKRTPAKFKRIDYRSYQIQYLEIKGFFRMFFGKAFDKIEKPYFCIIGDYVVFSNSPYTLIGLIEDYEQGRSLANTPYYQDYKLSTRESSVSLFASPTNMYPVILPLLQDEDKKEMSKNESFFQAFESAGFQLTSDADMLGTSVILTLSQEKDKADIELTDEGSLPKLYKRYGSEIDANTFVLQLIEDDIFKKFYPGSDIIEIDARTKDGVLNGDYTEYYKDGKVRAEGKYKKGRRKGTWKLYDENGEVTKKRY